MQISVKQHHLDRGIPGSSCECALALATNDAFRTALAGAEWISTTVGNRDGVKMRVETNTRVLFFDLPQPAEHFLGRYDGVFGKQGRAKAVPFTFEPIANEATVWKARTDATRYERLAFLSEQNGYLLYRRDPEGEDGPGSPQAMCDAEAAAWLGRNGHALHERLANRRMMTQEQYDKRMRDLYREHERMLDLYPERESELETRLSRRVDAIDHTFIHGPAGT